MKRSVLSSLCVASLVFSLGLVGCGGGGIEEGAPTGDPSKPVVPLDPKMVDMTGRSFDVIGKAKKKADADAKAQAAAPPVEEKKP